MASEAQTDRKEEARRDGDGSPPRRAQALTPAPSDRMPVDRVERPDTPVAVSRADFTATERRLLGDLFAIVEEHADEAAVVIDRDRVEEAFLFACEHHADQRRQSGEEFIFHPVGVAKICAGLRLDTETLCAALLHDTVEDTSCLLYTSDAADE